MPKHDKQIIELANNGLGARKIAGHLNLNVGQVSKRMKKLELNTDKRNQYEQYKPSAPTIKFQENKSNYPIAAETYLKYLCDLSGYVYADPPARLPYDLLVDFGKGWSKIQVKSTTTEFSTFELYKKQINTKRVIKEKYLNDEVDYFFLYKSPKECYLVPFKILESKGTVRANMVQNFICTIDGDDDTQQNQA